MNKTRHALFLLLIIWIFFNSCIIKSEQNNSINSKVSMADIDLTIYPERSVGETGISYKDIIIEIGDNFYEIRDDLGDYIHLWLIEDKLFDIFYPNLIIRFQKKSGKIEDIKILYYESYSITPQNTFRGSIGKNHDIKETEGITLKGKVTTGFDVEKILKIYGKPKETYVKNSTLIYYTDRKYKIRFDFSKRTLSKIEISLPNEEMTKYGSK